MLAAAAAVAGKLAPSSSRARTAASSLRPPGAIDEDDFRSRCIRCFRCGEVCENACIEFHDLDDGLDIAFTPYIHARSRGCTTCMKCGDVCPTGAIARIEPEEEAILAGVQMGLARLNKQMCYSFAEPAPRTCGVCYRACPFPGKAMTIGLYEQPTVHADQCVGCGLCEQACVHLPQAIRVIPIS
ncbi:MAG: 4Fe-4S dicluster domain-containing protein [Proteobacteria bacterium]|nr:4Fe-4S dicluster domain-containing protein [Pseudomonadota bacterium]MCP4919842.1 4Fe-4S dicluster domain-containing protein [Pseudomonadota bacterium]